MDTLDLTLQRLFSRDYIEDREDYRSIGLLLDDEDVEKIIGELKDRYISGQTSMYNGILLQPVYYQNIVIPVYISNNYITSNGFIINSPVTTQITYFDSSQTTSINTIYYYSTYNTNVDIFPPPELQRIRNIDDLFDEVEEELPDEYILDFSEEDDVVSTDRMYCAICGNDAFSLTLKKFNNEYRPLCSECEEIENFKHKPNNDLNDIMNTKDYELLFDTKKLSSIELFE